MTATPKPPADTAPRANLVGAAVVVCALLAFFALLAFPNEVPSPSLDSSWSGALAYLFVHRFHAGTDYVFTYGPLGFLLTAYFDPRTFWMKWLFEVLLKGIVVWEIARLARVVGSPARACVPLLVAAGAFAFAIYPGFVYTTDAFAYLVFVVLAAAPAVDRKYSLPRAAVTVAIVAVLSLAKSTLTVLALPAVVLCALRFAAQGRPAIQSPALWFPAVWLALWFAAGQGIRNIVPFFAGSAAVASGYAEAMATSYQAYRNEAIPVAVAAVALLGFLVALRIQADAWQESKIDKRETVIRIGYLLFLAAVALIAWKHGWTRGGNHSLIFLLTLASAAAFVFAVLPAGAKPLARNAVLGGAAALALLSAWRGDEGWFQTSAKHPPLLAPAASVFNPAGTFARMNAELDANRRAFALPRIKAAVGGASVGEWSYEQNALLLNGLNYRPQPSLQGYSDYNAALQARDIAFWASDAAPEYLLFKNETIDLRYPTLDGGTAWAAMLLRYYPVLTEEGFLLMRRRAPVHSLDTLRTGLPDARAVTAAMGQPIAVPPAPLGSLVLARITVTPTLVGRLRALLFKPAEVYLQVTVEGSDQPVAALMPPIMAGTGFVLSPLMRDGNAVLSAYRGEPGIRITQIRVLLPPDAEPCYVPEISARFYALPLAKGTP